MSGSENTTEHSTTSLRLHPRVLNTVSATPSPAVSIEVTRPRSRAAVCSTAADRARSNRARVAKKTSSTWDPQMMSWNWLNSTSFQASSRRADSAGSPANSAIASAFSQSVIRRSSSRFCCFTSIRAL